MDRTREREERKLFHRVIKKLVKRKQLNISFVMMRHLGL